MAWLHWTRMIIWCWAKCSLFFFYRITGLRQLVRTRNICTVGDLSMLSEHDVNNLPIRSPKVPIMKQALRSFASHQGIKIKTPEEAKAKASSAGEVTGDDLEEYLIDIPMSTDLYFTEFQSPAQKSFNIDENLDLKKHSATLKVSKSLNYMKIFWMINHRHDIETPWNDRNVMFPCRYHGVPHQESAPSGRYAG